MEKLYEENPYLTRFTGTVESCVPGKKGWEVVLDRTAFYPEGGGQPFDLGTLGGVPVQEVHEREGRVVHLCSSPLEVDSTVEGCINWARRFDLMQHHSGEHIVSGIAHAKWGCENVGFHMGADVITIDLSLPLGERELAELEQAANQYIWEDHPVSITFPPPAELETLEYRSKKALTGRVRIVSFPGADTCACCGTHVASSGQVGLVKLLSCQKFREGVRIELVCGGRALAYLSRILEQNRQVSNLLSAKPLETGAAAERLLGEAAGLKARLSALEARRFSDLASHWAGKGDVVLFEPDLSPDSLRRLCDAVLQTCGGRCTCFSGQDGQGYKYAIGQKGGDLRTLTKELNQALQGRGGGKPDFVQGSVQAAQKELETFFAGR
ncbi:MAG: alanyl-tRNA editing protein [Lawsonibacter sp.]|nr:alanyl-tRNA editing protein [Lawsonibacter sp.]